MPGRLGLPELLVIALILFFSVRAIANGWKKTSRTETVSDRPTAISTNAFCTSCGCKLTPHAQFCQSCGKSMSI
jgi:membrane protease subunit (stomatin/prohibitin family)